MTEEEAIRIALGSRPAFQVSDAFVGRKAEKRIIEVVEDRQPVRDAMPEPGPVRDVVAWVVRLWHEIVWAEFAIEDATGKVVRFRRSRGAVLQEMETKS